MSRNWRRFIAVPTAMVVVGLALSGLVPGADRVSAQEPGKTYSQEPTKTDAQEPASKPGEAPPNPAAAAPVPVEPPAAPHLHGQSDMFRTSQAAHVTPINDPRLRTNQIQYTPTDLKGAVLPPNAEPPRDETLVIIEGDIVMGSLEEIQRGVAANLLQQIGAIPADDPALDSLTPEQRAAWDQLRRSRRPPEDRAAIDGRAALVGRLLQQATALGMTNDRRTDAVGQVAAATAAVRKKIAQAPVGNVGQAPGALDEQVVQFAVPVRAGVGGFLWPGGVIGWQFHSTFPQSQRQSVIDAVNHWNAKTNHIRFVRLTQTNQSRFQNWIVIVPGEGCAARVGMRPSPGGQAVLLAPGCGTPQAIHELGHIIGLWHEQSRNNRDQFIRVNYANIAPSTRYNFDLVGQNGLDFGTRLDFDSIMMYPANAFSNGQGPSMVRLDGGNANFGIFTPGVGGSVTSLSATDIAGVEYLYPTPARVSQFEPEMESSPTASQLALHHDTMAAHEVAIYGHDPAPRP